MNKILLLMMFGILFSQNTDSFMKSWENIVQTSEVVDYFNGVFEKIGISIEETGEYFTVYHQGDTITLNPSIDPNSDFIVPLKAQHIRNMISHSEDGIITSEESWRILCLLFTPLTKATLQTPILSVNWRRMLAGVEDLTHVYLISPDNQEANKHSLIYVKGQWLVLEGLHGETRRTYRMDESESLLYQRNIFSAMKDDSFIGWMQFGLWYKRWRKTVSITHKLKF